MTDSIFHEWVRLENLGKAFQGPGLQRTYAGEILCVQWIVDPRIWRVFLVEGGYVTVTNSFLTQLRGGAEAPCIAPDRSKGVDEGQYFDRVVVGPLRQLYDEKERQRAQG